MKNIDIRNYFLYVLFFFVASCVGTKNNKSNVVLSHIPTEVSDFKIEEPKEDKSKEETALFKLSPEGVKWVDSIYNGLSFDEKLGQLFMVAAYSNKDNYHVNAIDKLITENKIGGLIFFQGGPLRQAKLTNRYQAKSKIPLFIGNDAEWGLSMRLDSTYSYPYNMTLGAVQDMTVNRKNGESN